MLPIIRSTSVMSQMYTSSLAQAACLECPGSNVCEDKQVLAAQARKEAIEERLQQIRASSPNALVRQSWEQHHGVMCAGVYWDRYSEHRCFHIFLSMTRHGARKIA